MTDQQLRQRIVDVLYCFDAANTDAIYNFIYNELDERSPDEIASGRDEALFRRVARQMVWLERRRMVLVLRVDPSTNAPRRSVTWALTRPYRAMLAEHRETVLALNEQGEVVDG